MIMTKSKIPTTAMLAMLAVALGGCGGSGGGEAGGDTAIQASQATAASVGSGGGTITATASNGVRYTLEIPSGALTEPVEIRITPVDDMGNAPLASGVVGAVQFEPSGLVFLRPATLRITDSRIASIPAGANQLVGFISADDGTNFHLNLIRLEGDTAILGISHFSIGGASEATEAELAPIIPVLPISFTEDEAIAALAGLIAEGASDAAIVDVFRKWYLTLVKPALQRADGSSDIVFEMDGIGAYNRWISNMDFSADPAALKAALAAELNEAAPVVRRVYISFIDRQLSACRSQNSLDALDVASAFQRQAQDVGVATSGSGLERSAFLVRVNDCLRVVIDPISVPAPRLGQDMSVDARAQIVFDASNPRDATFAFSASASGATLRTPSGFSDAAGRFTTVFRPSDTTVAIAVTACLILPTVGASDICATQNATTSQNPLVVTTHCIVRLSSSILPSGAPVITRVDFDTSSNGGDESDLDDDGESEVAYLVSGVTASTQDNMSVFSVDPGDSTFGAIAMPALSGTRYENRVPPGTYFLQGTVSDQVGQSVTRGMTINVNGSGGDAEPTSFDALGCDTVVECVDTTSACRVVN